MSEPASIALAVVVLVLCCAAGLLSRTIQRAAALLAIGATILTYSGLTTSTWTLETVVESVVFCLPAIGLLVGSAVRLTALLLRPPRPGSDLPE